MTYKIVPSTILHSQSHEVLKEASQKKKSYFLITKRNKPIAAIVNLDLLENLLAATNSEYLKSIKEAREDYKKGRVYTHGEVFGKL